MHIWEEGLKQTREFNKNMKLHSIIQKKYMLCMMILQQVRLKYSSEVKEAGRGWHKEISKSKFSKIHLKPSQNWWKTAKDVSVIMVTFNFTGFNKCSYLISDFAGVKQDLDTFTSVWKFDIYRTQQLWPRQIGCFQKGKLGIFAHLRNCRTYMNTGLRVHTVLFFLS